MSREVLLGWIQPIFAVLLLWYGPLPSKTFAGNPVTVQLHSGLSNPIYVDAGTVKISFSYWLNYGGRGNPSKGQAQSLLVYSASGVLLATLPISYLNAATERLGSAEVIWNNPVSQFIELSGEIYVLGYGNNFFEWWYLPEGRSAATGGDTPPNAPPIVSVTPTPPQQTGSNPPPPPSSARSNIHAVIISGLSDPAKVISSINVTVTGGIVALGKNVSPPAVPSAWSPGLEIIPDYALLTGQKIPPVTPNIIDVRIVRQEVTADFPSPNP
jgi:hypothetical protein